MSNSPAARRGVLNPITTGRAAGTFTFRLPLMDRCKPPTPPRPSVVSGYSTGRVGEDVWYGSYFG